MFGVKEFRKKPIIVEALQLGEDDFNIAQLSGWLLAHGERNFKIHGEDRPFGIALITLEGTMVASPGDWIIRGVQGEFYPCKSDIFEATYEALAVSR